jgi:hypothetical protein
MLPSVSAVAIVSAAIMTLTAWCISSDRNSKGTHSGTSRAHTHLLAARLAHSVILMNSLSFCLGGQKCSNNLGVPQRLLRSLRRLMTSTIGREAAV